jgi:hypothetical protein
MCGEDKELSIKLKLRGFSPRANYTDRHLSTKLVLTFADRACRVVSVADSYGRDLGFLDRKKLSTEIQNIIHTQTSLQVTLKSYKSGRPSGPRASESCLSHEFPRSRPLHAVPIVLLRQ